MKKKRFGVLTIIADILILAVSFLIMVWYKPASLRSYLPSHFPFFAVLTIVWLVVSLLNGKMNKGKIMNLKMLFSRVITSNIISLSITALLMYSFRQYDYSRLVVFGTAMLATFFELSGGVVFLAFKKARVQDVDQFERVMTIKKPSENELVGDLKKNIDSEKVTGEVKPSVVTTIEKECGREMAKAVAEMSGSRLNGKSAILSTTSIFNIHSLPLPEYSYIINLHLINDIRSLDSFLEAVNSKLETNGYFLCCVETKDQRKSRILDEFPPVLNYIYYFFDFIISFKLLFYKRVFVPHEHFA